MIDNLVGLKIQILTKLFDLMSPSLLIFLVDLMMEHNYELQPFEENNAKHTISHMYD